MTNLEIISESFQGLLAQACLSALLAIVGVVVVAKILKKIRVAFSSLWRKSRFSFAAVMLLSLTMFLWADKTNLLRLIIHPDGPPVVVVSAEDILRGYRLESVATNCAAETYAMPDGVSPTFNWHKRGTFGEWARLALGDFAFPLGTNGEAFTSFSVFNDGKIRPRPRDVAHEICAVGVPMLAMQGASRFWTADGEGGSKLLTWENFFLNADTNAPVNAQIQLSPNGDFTTKSNALETVYRRVSPHDWDGDGLANEIDAHPTTSDGDFFGTSVDWLNVNCAGVLSAATNGQGEVEISWHTNANPNAYYWLDLTATGALGVAKITATCAEESNLGDLAVIARTNEVCRVPLLVGATYTVESDLPISYSSVSSEYANIFTNSEYSLVVSLPLEFSLERIQTRSGGGPVNYAVSSSPINVFPSVAAVFGGCCSPQAVGGLLQWSCSSTCTCGGDNHYIDVVSLWEGYSKAFLGYALCACGYDAPNPIPTPVMSPYAASVSVNFGNNAVIFEDAYENKPGEWVSRRSTATTLTIHANGGPNGGLLTVFGTNLGKLQKNSGPAFPTQSVEVPANQSITYEINYVGLTASEATNDVVVTATLAENGSSMLSASTELSVVEVKMLADVAAPDNACTRRHVYGVHEMVNVELQPTESGAALAFDSDAGFAYYGSGHFWCPWTGGVYTVTFNLGDIEFGSQINVFEPVPLVADVWWDGVSGTIGTAGKVVMNMELLLAPLTVSFMSVWVVEIPDEEEGCPHFGYFDNSNYGRPWSHTSEAGAGKWFLVTRQNEWTHDRAGTTKDYPYPWSIGWKVWDIPIGWSDRMGVVKGRSRPYSETERFEIDEFGTVTVRKFGHWIKREINNHVWVDGIRVDQ